MNSSFQDLLKAKWNEGKFVCVGLDGDYDLLPESIKDGSKESSIFNFNKSIIDAVSGLVAAFKPQVAHYEEAGLEGWSALSKTVKYLKEKHPKIPVILDAKRADIGSTNSHYAKAIFDYLGFDAVTVNPYFGKESLEPFLKYKDKGIIILVKTSNPGAGELQDLVLKEQNIPLYQYLAGKIASGWNYNGNCGVVVGATYPEELKKVREIIGMIPILIPGIGAQGGDLEATVRNGIDKNKQGILIHSSRSIIYASKDTDFAEAAKKETEKLDNEIRRIIHGG